MWIWIKGHGCRYKTPKIINALYENGNVHYMKISGLYENGNGSAVGLWISVVKDLMVAVV